MALPNRPGRLEITLAEIAKLVNGTLDGPGDLLITRLSSAEDPQLGSIAFAEKSEFVLKAKEGGAAAVLLSAEEDSLGLPAIRVASPRFAFLHLLQLTDPPLPLNAAIHPTAVVDPTAEIHPDSQIGPYAVVERSAKISAGVKVYAFAYIGEGCELGEGCQIHPHAVLVRDVALGKNCVVHPGAVLGADGFGFMWDGKRQVKIPQVGNVVIQRDVEIGANSTVDRAMSGSTRIGEGTKLDNLVQVAHNASIGRDGVIAALVGIAGSASIGDRVMMGGQCAVVDHGTVGNDIQMAGRTAVIGKLDKPGQYFGAPAMPAKEGMRNFILLTRLGELFSRVRKLEKILGAKESE